MSKHDDSIQLTQLRLEMATQRNEHATKVSKLMAELRTSKHQSSQLADENDELKRTIKGLRTHPQQQQQQPAPSEAELWESRAMDALDESAAIASQLERTMRLLTQSRRDSFWLRCTGVISWVERTRRGGFEQWRHAMESHQKRRVQPATPKGTLGRSKLQAPAAGRSKGLHKSQIPQPLQSLTKSRNPLYSAGTPSAMTKSSALAQSPWTGNSKWRKQLNQIESELSAQELAVLHCN